MPREGWQADGAAQACNQCEHKFSMYWRRHHCRSCGKMFCGNCSRSRHDFGAGAQRVCDGCKSALDPEKMEAAAAAERAQQDALEKAAEMRRVEEAEEAKEAARQAMACQDERRRGLADEAMTLGTRIRVDGAATCKVTNTVHFCDGKRDGTYVYFVKPVFGLLGCNNHYIVFDGSDLHWSRYTGGSDCHDGSSCVPLRKLRPEAWEVLSVPAETPAFDHWLLEHGFYDKKSRLCYECERHNAQIPGVCGSVWERGVRAGQDHLGKLLEIFEDWHDLYECDVDRLLESVFSHGSEEEEEEEIRRFRAAVEALAKQQRNA